MLIKGLCDSEQSINTFTYTSIFNIFLTTITLNIRKIINSSMKSIIARIKANGTDLYSEK